MTQYDGLGQILAWSSDCHAWQRDALRRLCSGSQIDDQDCDELYEIIQGQRAAAPLSADHIPARSKKEEIVSLLAIANAENVNALAKGQVLSFTSSGLTIVYGENGSGKSGYVRILKSACRARVEKKFEIIGNVFDGTTYTPTAEVRFALGSTHKKHIWTKGQSSPGTLSAVSVFDSNTAAVHATGSNEVAYTPFPLKVLAQLTRAADSLKRRIKEDIAKQETAIPAFIVNPECSVDSPVGKLVRGLNHLTELADIDSISPLNDGEREELARLRKEMADDLAVIARKYTRLGQRLENLCTAFSALYEYLGDAATENILEQKKALSEKEAIERVAAHDLFENEALRGIGDPIWQNLWNKAEEYSRNIAYQGETFPYLEDDALCVLCHQPLSHDTIERLQRFREFVTHELGKEIKRLRDVIQAAFSFANQEYLSPRKIAEVRDYLSGSDETKLAAEVANFLVRCAWRRRWLRRAGSDEVSLNAPALMAPPISALQACAASLRTKAKALENSAVSPEHKSALARLIELADQDWLCRVRDDVKRAASTKKNIYSLNDYLAQTATNRITIQATTIAKELITDKLRDRFAAEIAELGVARLRVELRQEPSSSGEARFKVCFIAKPNQVLGPVLSEGEFRCLAIAAFLAELATAENHSAIVFDDPVSSLDHVHRQCIANRLAEEAKRRQIIVFTHDIPFLSVLQHACKERGTPFSNRLISRGGNVPGFCRDDPPPNFKPCEVAITSAEKYLDGVRFAYEGGDMEKWDGEVTKIGGVLRKLWERAIEESISPVLSRWQHKIDTKQFSKLTVFNQLDHEEMRKGYGQCSIWEHYQPAAGNVPLPAPEQIRAEIDRLKAWQASVSGRQKAMKTV